MQVICASQFALMAAASERLLVISLFNRYGRYGRRLIDQFFAKHARLHVLVLMLFMLSGCAAVRGFPDRSLDPEGEIKSLEKYLGPSAINAFDSPRDAERAGLTRRAWRNAVLEARIRVDDLNFADFEQTLYKQGVGFGVGTDWIVLALNGVGAVVSGGATNALAAASAGVVGARGSFDKNALYEKTLPVLLGQMAAGRKDILVRIREGEKLNETAYPLTRGLSDLEDYYFSGSIPGALRDIAENSGMQAKKADERLSSLQTVGPVPPELQARRENAAAFVKTLSEEGVHALAQAISIPSGEGELSGLLSTIAAAQTTTQFDLIAQQIMILFGRSF